MNGGAREQADVIVVGAGSAAFAAALACYEGGAQRIVMLEKAPEPEFGGNPRFSHSGFRWVQSGPHEVREFIPHVDEATFARMVFRPYTEEDFDAHLTRATQGRIDPALKAAVVGDSNAAVHWLRRQGLKWKPKDRHIEIDGKLHFEPGYSIYPAGGGIGQLNRLRELALAKGIEIRYESKAAGLLGSMHRFEGVHVESPDGDYDMTAPITFLCSGGFQASAEMRARYLGPNADLMKVRGSRHNTGEVLRMAIELGAKPAGHWQTGHASMVDANAPDFGIYSPHNTRYSYPYGISVNTLGQRFMDEGANLRMLTYSRTGWVTLAEPGGLAWQIFDQKVIRRQSEIMRPSYAYAKVRVEADTIESLAGKTGIDPEVLARTVQEYNASCRDNVAFDPGRPDGKATVGLNPPKSNWAQRIDEPPFVAFPVTAGITFTFGGVAINDQAQVLNTSGTPIEGLYASGDIVGFFYHGYVGSTGQTRNVVFARRGAAHATGL